MLSPMRSSCVIAAYVSAAVCRGLLVGLAVWLLALCLGYVVMAHVLLLCVILLATACVFALLGMINAFYARTYDGIAFVPQVVLMPLIYLGGVFYPLQQLPLFWRHVSLFNPIAYLIDLARFAMLGYADFSLSLATLVTGICIVVLYAWCYNCLLYTSPSPRD